MVSALVFQTRDVSSILITHSKLNNMKYIKPTYKIVEIIMNDLCAGSVCSHIDIKIEKIQKSKHKTYVFLHQRI